MEKLAEYGILGAVLTAVFSGGGTALWFLLREGIRARDADLSWHRQWAKESQAGFLQALTEWRLLVKDVSDANTEQHQRLTHEIRELRHYLRDLAHQIGLRQAVEGARAGQGPDPDN